MHANIEAKVGDQTVKVEVIGVGDQGWMTNPFNRQWQPLPNGTTIKDIFDPAQGVKAIIGSLQDAQVVGQEKVDGADTWHVKGTIQSDALTAPRTRRETRLTVGIEVWIGVDDSLIRRVYLEGPIEPGEADNIVRQLTLSDFGEQRRAYATATMTADSESAAPTQPDHSRHSPSRRTGCSSPSALPSSSARSTRRLS